MAGLREWKRGGSYEVEYRATLLYILAWRSGSLALMIPHVHACHYTMQSSIFERLVCPFMSSAFAMIPILRATGLMKLDDSRSQVGRYDFGEKLFYQV
jgi:hypothetical protein